jgi:hypothetical protein
MIFNEANLGKAIEFIVEIFKRGKEVKIDQYRKIRSISQNKLMWLYMAAIEKETGNDRNYMKQYYQEKYLPTEIQVIKGLRGIEIKKIEVVKGTSELDTLQFTEFLNKIRQDAEETFTSDRDKPFILPNPEDLKFKHFVDYYSRYLAA